MSDVRICEKTVQIIPEASPLVKLLHLGILRNLRDLFSTQTSDRDQIWHACADRDETGSHLKKIPPIPEGARGLSIQRSFVPAFVRSLPSLRSTIRAVSPPFGEEPWCSEWFKQLGSLQYVRCRHRSVNCEPRPGRGRTTSTRLSKNSSFISLQRTQAAMEYDCESLHHKK